MLVGDAAARAGPVSGGFGRQTQVARLLGVPTLGVEDLRAAAMLPFR
jgi:hypothetical protein